MNPVVETRVGVIAAIACGTGAALSLLAPQFTLATIAVCAYMIADALATPD